MPRRWLLVVMFFALGCSGGASAVRPRGPAWIAKIEVEGSHAISQDELVPHLALDRTRRGGRAVDPYQLQLDTERVRQAYIRKGFFDVKVESRVEGETGPQKVIFKVVEGKRATTKVSITGLPAEVRLEDARKLVPLEDGAPFDYEIYDLAKEEVTKLVESAGYPYVELDAAVTVDKGVATARYSFEAGPRCTFGQIQIIGVEGKLRQAVINRLDFKAGDVFSTAAIERTQHNLYDMGRFSTVHIEPDLTGNARTIPIRIVTTPGGRGELRLGGGGGYDSVAPEIRFRGGISHIPRALPLWTFGIDARIALAFRSLPDGSGLDPEWRIRTLATARRLDLFYPKLIGEIGAGYDYLTFESYTMTGPLAQLGVTLPAFARSLQLRIGWTFALQSFSNLSDVFDDVSRVEYHLDRSRRLASYQQNAVVDLRDDPTNTRKGAYAALRIAEGTPYAGGEYSFVELTPELRLYAPLGPFVFAFRARAGAIFGDIPATERFFAGGIGSQRGFPYRQLAPSLFRVVDGETHSALIGGTAIYETSLEARATVGTIKELPIIASLFVDGAENVLEKADLFKRVPHIALGVGFGVLVNESFKIYLEIGHRMNRTGPTEPNYSPDDLIENTEIQLGIGDAF